MNNEFSHYHDSMFLFMTISDCFVYLLNLFQAHGIDHLVIPTRDYLFAPSFVDINRAVQFIHSGFFQFYLILGRGINPSINVVLIMFYVLENSFACVVYLTFLFYYR